MLAFRRLLTVTVGGVFSSVASKYDIMNDTMSAGIHRLWKDDFVASVLPRLPPSVHRNPVRADGTQAPDHEPAAPAPFKVLDVAGGTGDIALRLLDRAREKFGSRDIEVEVVDLTEGMLHEGRKRVAQGIYYNSELWRRAMCEERAGYYRPGPMSSGAPDAKSKSPLAS